MRHVEWPNEMPIPDKIGAYYFTKKSQPCCAVGWFRHSLGTPMSEWPERGASSDCEAEWRRAYLDVCEADGANRQDRESPWGVVSQNDSSTPRTRLLRYLASLARLGYVTNMPKDALRLAAKAEEMFGPFQFTESDA